MGVSAECEQSRSSERPVGAKAARVRGDAVGRLCKLSLGQIEFARMPIEDRGERIAAVARSFEASKPMLYRALQAG